MLLQRYVQRLLLVVLLLWVQKLGSNTVLWRLGLVGLFGRLFLLILKPGRHTVLVELEDVFDRDVPQVCLVGFCNFDG